MNKVYCSDCKHLTKTHECAHPNNIELRSSWYTSKIVMYNSEMNKPHLKNMNNDCDLFKQKSMWQSFKECLDHAISAVI